MPCGYGGVGRKDGGVGHPLTHCGQIIALGQLFPDSFQKGKGGVPLVEMQQIMLNPQFLQDNRTSDPQNDFLAQTLFQIPDLEPGADIPVPGVVHCHIGIQQVQGDSPHTDLPHRDMNGRIGERYRNNELLAVFIHNP